MSGKYRQDNSRPVRPYKCSAVVATEQHAAFMRQHGELCDPEKHRQKIISENRMGGSGDTVTRSAPPGQANGPAPAGTVSVQPTGT
jgi:hypothetical protein